MPSDVTSYQASQSKYNQSYDWLEVTYEMHVTNSQVYMEVHNGYGDQCLYISIFIVIYYVYIQTHWL